MCGRYVSAGDLADLSVLLGANPFDVDHTKADRPDANRPSPDRPSPDQSGAIRVARADLLHSRRFGLAPTDPVPAVLPGPEPGSRQLDLLTWGLVPAWADPATAARRINARVETVLEKPSFRRAARARRALLPADGWYEWVRDPDGTRRPQLVRPADGGILAFAGLYERWYSPAGDASLSCAILTGPAPAPLAWLHERAPLVVPPELWSDWLDPGSDADGLLNALRTASPRLMVVQPVSAAINYVRNTGPALIEAAPTEAAAIEPAPVEPLPGAVEQLPLW
ncbi:MAG TPA: SOS response-associated peptidase [Frankiaceae bacterium]|nr:SOS response-associated peptidase [Frankiaceae bacterium]